MCPLRITSCERDCLEKKGEKKGKDEHKREGIEQDAELLTDRAGHRDELPVS